MVAWDILHGDLRVAANKAQHVRNHANTAHIRSQPAVSDMHALCSQSMQTFWMGRQGSHGIHARYMISIIVHESTQPVLLRVLTTRRHCRQYNNTQTIRCTCIPRQIISSPHVAVQCASHLGRHIHCTMGCTAVQCTWARAWSSSSSNGLQHMTQVQSQGWCTRSWCC